MTRMEELDPTTKLASLERLVGEKWCQAWQEVEGEDNYAGYLGGSRYNLKERVRIAHPAEKVK